MKEFEDLKKAIDENNLESIKGLIESGLRNIEQLLDQRD
jgi:hypothetical protein